MAVIIYTFHKDKLVKRDFVIVYIQPHLITPAPLPLSQWERGRGVAEGRGVRVRSTRGKKFF
jgi:hypothetical protein